MATALHRPEPTLKEGLIDRAFLEGFDAAGIARPPLDWSARSRLERFLALGRHGSMGWLAARAHHRAHPNDLWADCRSILMVALNYGPAHDPRDALKTPTLGNISCYAQGADYHDVLKKRLKRLARWFASESGAEVKLFVDTAPVMEKPLAALAGLGWQGKHTNLVSRDLGSWTFLGALFTAVDLPPDRPEVDHCGSCRACLDACPTNAFPAPYQLDARRCLSYLTIEHEGPIPEEFRAAMGNRIYGCDDCLAACPWNKFAETAREAAFFARAELRAPSLADLLDLDDQSFRTVFSGSPIKRIGRTRFIRNVLIASGNSGDLTLVPLVERLKADPSPVIRDAAYWALDKLQPGARLN
ncbi:MAG: tRNA epoxyqueuosine(34) reductase QueG [Pseudomonadota bacterium]